MIEAVEKVRKEFKAFDDIRDKGLTTPEYLIRYDDIIYGQNKEWQKLDLYIPNDYVGSLPVIVSVHGGAWVYGDKERYQYYCMNLVKYGFAVVNFTYRLAPEYKFPSQIEDIDLVFRWIYENANTYKLDLSNVFAVGDSAGAHQLGLYATAITSDNYAKRYNFSFQKDVALKAIGLNCGQYQMQLNKEEEITDKLMEAYLEKGGSEDEISMVNLVDNITSDFPPCFIMTSTGDFLKMQVTPLINRLVELNVSHEYHFYGDKDKELGHVFHLDMRSADAELMNSQQCEYFRSFI